MIMTSYDLASPVTEKEAGERGLPHGIGRLVVSFDRDTNLERSISTCLCEARCEGHALIAQSIIPYRSIAKLKKALTDGGLIVWTDNEIIAENEAPNNLLVRCESVSMIMEVLGRMSSEAIVYYNLPVADGVPQFVSEIIEASLDGYFEASFLKHIDQCNGFWFYQSTHESIEMMGSCEMVEEYLSKLKHL